MRNGHVEASALAAAFRVLRPDGMLIYSDSLADNGRGRYCGRAALDLGSRIKPERQRQ
jgi:hypothetical protein